MVLAVASKQAPLAAAGLVSKIKLLLAAAPSASGAAPSVAAALRPACAAAPRRLFSTGGAPFPGGDADSESKEGYTGDDLDDAAYALLRPRGFSLPMRAEIAYVIGEPICMGRMLMLAAAVTKDEAAARGCCGCWVLNEDVDKVKLKVAMPGLGKEHVKVWAEKNDLVIEAEGDRDTEFDDDGEDPARYRHRIQFPEDALEMDQIKAEMKDGVLKVTVPKIKFEEEPQDVFEVKIKREESAGLYGMSRSPSSVVLE